jgi:hypothetical protein
MNIKNFSIYLPAILSLIFVQSTAFSTPTKWENVSTSMDELLNSGWQISGHGTSRAATAPGPGVAAMDVETFTFILTKNGKYIICRTINPNPPVANDARCRRLN